MFVYRSHPGSYQNNVINVGDFFFFLWLKIPAIRDTPTKQYRYRGRLQKLHSRCTTIRKCVTERKKNVTERDWASAPAVTTDKDFVRCVKLIQAYIYIYICTCIHWTIILRAHINIYILYLYVYMHMRLGLAFCWPAAPLKPCHGS